MTSIAAALPRDNAEGEEESPAMNNDVVETLMNKSDIWDHSILPFVGIGYSAFVKGQQAATSFYKQYGSSLQNPPLVKLRPSSFRYRPSKYSDTFYSVAFADVSCAEVWYNNTRNQPRYHKVCANAAKIGNLPVLKWARDKGFSWNASTCAQAAESGHLEVLKWARENGCPWDKRTYQGARKSRHLDMLKWLQENDCPWNEDTSHRAERNFTGGDICPHRF